MIWLFPVFVTVRQGPGRLLLVRPACSQMPWGSSVYARPSEPAKLRLWLRFADREPGAPFLQAISAPARSLYFGKTVLATNAL